MMTNDPLETAPEPPTITTELAEAEAEPLQPRARRPFNLESLSFVLLLLVLVIGAYFRFSGLDWDANFHLHPDERFLTDLATKLEPTFNPSLYLRSSESPMNPYNVGMNFYVYGNFPMTVTRYLAEWVTGSCANFENLCQYVFNSYNGVHILGRFLSGLADLMSVLLLFLIGRRLYHWRAGLLAALLHAAAVMPIQQSHFFTMDNWAAWLTTMTIYGAVRAAGLGDERPVWRLRWWLFFGLSLGLAVASRINIAPLAVTAGIAAVIWMVKRGHSWQAVLTRPAALTDLQRVFIGVALAAAVSLLTFRLAQPYAFTDAALVRQAALQETGVEPGPLTVFVKSIVGFHPQWRANMEEIQRLQQPDANFPPALQWTDREPIIFPLTNMVLYGMGITAAIAAWAGLLWAVWRIVTAHPEWTAHAIPVFWSGAYFLFMGTRWVKSIRYFLPIYPTLFLIAAWAVFALAKRLGRRRAPAFRRILLASLLALVALPSLLWAKSFITIYQQPVTRVAASEWMFEAVPSGATILYESGGESRQLQLPLKQYDFFAEVTSPLLLTFEMPADGTITGVRFNYASAIESDGRESTVSLRLDQADPVETRLSLDLERRPVTIEVAPTAVSAGSIHQISAELAPGSGPIHLDTSWLVVEHWDDLLPVSLDGKNAFGSYYAAVTNNQVPITHPDSPDKRIQLIEWLDQADYVVLSSQRAVWHMPRLPLSFPLTVSYYDGLFSGALDYQLVGQFHADFKIGPLHISDTAGKVSWGAPPDVGWPPPGDAAAEEAFSVYDHPPVWIFAKTDSYRRDAVVQRFGSIDVTQAIPMTPGEATQSPNGLMLTGAAWQTQRANGTFSQVFAPDGLLSRQPAIGAVVWYLSIVLLGWLAFPLTFAVMGGLPDRGYALSRILSLLFISYLTWLAASLDILPHTRGTLLLAALLLGLLSTLVFLRRRREIAAFVRQRLAYIGLVEALGLLFFLILIIVRLGNPDVWDVIWGGEKPMDMAYFTAVLKSTSFPPYDPWFAGGYINYYYYGFVYVGALTKLLGIVPAVAYNLILPTLFSFTGLGVFSIAHNLVAWRSGSPQPVHAGGSSRFKKFLAKADARAVYAGLIASVLAVIAGNLAQVGVVLSAWYRTGSSDIASGGALANLAQTADGALKVLSGQPAQLGTGDWFWTASRAINMNPGEVIPITEFPYFTFLYGDLHAHMISMPLMILALGWAVGLALQPPERRESSWWLTGLQWLVGGVAIGALRATNTWDWPTYLVIGSLAVLFHFVRRHKRVTLLALAQAGVAAGLLVGISILSFLPYAQHYGVGYTSFKLWPGSYTYLPNYLTVHGFFLFFISIHLLLEFRDWARGWTMETLVGWERWAAPVMISLLLYVLLLILLVGRGYLVAPVALTLVVTAGLLGLRRDVPPARRVILILISAAVALTLFVEIFVLDGDIGRMNTVFKFYMQVWLILSIVAGVTAVWSWPRVKVRPGARKVWRVALALLIFASALYPILATRAKWAIRMSKEAPHTLDGMAFMETTSYGDSGVTVPLKYDYEALNWMMRHIDGSPVIAEAHSSNPYRSVGNRVSMYTGLPTIVGWDWHQRQQRAVLPGTRVSQRISDVQRLYSTLVPAEALSLVARYQVEYIYVGTLEQVYYSPLGLAKFEQMVQDGSLETVYQNERTRIYHVVN